MQRYLGDPFLWRPEPPNEPGWYWYTETETSLGVGIVEVYPTGHRQHDGGRLYRARWIYIEGEIKKARVQALYVDDMGGFWAGPLPKPRFPYPHTDKIQS